MKLCPITFDNFGQAIFFSMIFWDHKATLKVGRGGLVTQFLFFFGGGGAEDTFFSNSIIFKKWGAYPPPQALSHCGP